jgi:hypothetical protein
MCHQSAIGGTPGGVIYRHIAIGLSARSIYLRRTEAWFNATASRIRALNAGSAIVWPS